MIAIKILQNTLKYEIHNVKQELSLQSVTLAGMSVAIVIMLTVFFLKNNKLNNLFFLHGIYQVNRLTYMSI